MQKPYISRLGSNWEVLSAAGRVVLSTPDFAVARVALDREFAK